MILIWYYSQTPETRALYESMDGPTGRPGDNPSHSDRLGVHHQIIPELTVWVYWQPGLPIWQRLGLDPDPDPKWQSGTVANTNRAKHHLWPSLGRSSLLRILFIRLQYITIYFNVYFHSWAFQCQSQSHSCQRYITQTNILKFHSSKALATVEWWLIQNRYYSITLI